MNADEYASRAPVGRLNGIGSEPGTLLGPDSSGRWFVVLRSDERGVTVGFATATDMDAAAERGPRSVAELGGGR